jgi:quinol monooxygenase YgiN
MGKIMSVARFRIHPGKLDEFKRLSAQSVELVRAKDPATTIYDWFMNDTQTECVAIDCYDSSEAVLAHTRNVGAVMRQIMQISDISVEILGSPSEELLRTLQAPGIKVLPLLHGL